MAEQFDDPWAGGQNQTYGPFAKKAAPYTPDQAVAASVEVQRQQPKQDLSFAAFSKATQYDQQPWEKQAELRNKYRTEIIPMMARQHGGSASVWAAEFDQMVPEPQKPQRSFVEAASDYNELAAKGAAGAIKSLTDVFGADNKASQWLDEKIKQADQNMSAAAKDEIKRERLEASQLGADAGLAERALLKGKQIARNPGSTIAEGVGAVLPMAVGGLAGIGLKGMIFLSSLMGMGAVKGGIYDGVMNASKSELEGDSDYKTLVGQGVPEKDAREQVAILRQAYADNPGKIGAGGVIGALMGRFGVSEQALASIGKPGGIAALRKQIAEGGFTGSMKAGGKEAAQESPQEMTETYLGNAGAASGGATVDPMQGVPEAGVAAAAMSFVPGAGLNYARGRAAADRLQAMGVDPSATLYDDLLNGTPPVVPPAGTTSSTQQIGYDRPAGGLGWNPEGLAGGAGAVAGQGVPGFNPEQAIADAATMNGTLGGRIAEVNLRFLDSAWRTGGEAAVRELAQQTNTIGVAARRFIAALDASRVPRQLEGPAPLLGLPSPDDASGLMVAGPDGVTEASNREAQKLRQDAEIWRQRQQETGLTPDVVQAQAARAASQGAQETQGQDAQSGAVPRGGADAGAAAGPLSNVGADGQALKPVVLQNRDRESANSIAQMQQIAKNPDYNRVSISRQLSEGAPVVIDEVQLPDAQLGREDFASDAQGRRVRVRYGVVEASDLLASHTADGQAVQGYERGAKGKLRVVAGNGRVAGIQRAYTNGNALQYRTDFQGDGQSHGIDPQVIAGMNAPVLVRLMNSADVTPDIGDRTNTSGVGDLSVLEQAKNDARRVDLTDLEFDEDGKPTPASIQTFIRVTPQSERGKMVTNDGGYNRIATDRLMAAVFWKAYQSEELVDLYAQAVDAEAKTVLAGLADAASMMMQLEGQPFDIRDLVVEAAQAAVNASRKGLSLAKYASTPDMNMSGDARVVVDFFARNIRSARRIGQGLRDAAQFALSNTGEMDMFGDAVQATRSDVINQLRGQDDTRTAQGDADAGRVEPAQVDAFGDGGADGQDQQGPGGGAEVAAGQGAQPPEARPPAVTGNTPNQPASAGFSLPETQENDDGAQADQAQQAEAEQPQAPATPAVGAGQDLLTSPTPEQLRATGNNGSFDPTNPDIRYSSSSTRTGQRMSASQVKSITDAIKSRWANAPEVVVAASMNDPAIPERVREANDKAKALGAKGEPEGFYFGGKVYVIADQMGKPGDVTRVMFHEALGHAGLRGVFGKALDGVLKQIVAARRAKVIAKARQYGLVQKDANGKPVVDVKTATDAEVFAAMSEQDRMTAAEEVLAEMAQENPKLSWVQSAIAAVRQWLRQNVPSLYQQEMTDAEIVRQFLVPAREFVERGPGGNAATVPVFNRSGGAMQRNAIDRRDKNGDPLPEEAKFVEQGIEGKDPIQAAEWLRDNAPDKDRALIAERVISILKDFQQAGIELEMAVAKPGDLVAQDLQNARGVTIYSPDKGRLFVALQGSEMTGKVGTSFRTLTHELVHAATMLQIGADRQQIVQDPQIRQAVDDLFDVSRAVMSHLRGRRAQPESTWTDFEQEVFRGDNNFVKEPDEILAWAMSDRRAQAYMEAIPYQSKNAWTAFVESVRKLLGLSAKADTALSEAIRIFDDLAAVRGRQLAPLVGFSGRKQLSPNTRRGEFVSVSWAGSPPSTDFEPMIRQEELGAAMSRSTDQTDTPMFSRGDRPTDEAMDFTRDGRADSESLVNLAKAKDADGLQRQLNSKWGDLARTLNDSFHDAMGPAKRWIEGLDASDKAKRALLSGLYRGAVQRDALQQEAKDKHGQKVLQGIAKIAKKKGLDAETAQKLVGYWLTANYAPKANDWLLEKDRRALAEAQKSGDPDAIAEAQQKIKDRTAAINDRTVKNVKRSVGVAGGLNNAQAALMKQNIEKRIDRADLEAVAQEVYGLLKWKRDLDVRTGKVTQAMVDSWPKHADYVPLTGSPFTSLDEDVFGTGTNLPNVAKDKAIDGRTESVADDGISAVWREVSKSATHAGFQDFKAALNGVYEDTLLATGSKREAEDALGLRRQEGEGLVSPGDDVVIYRNNGKTRVFRFDDREVMAAIKKGNVEEANKALTLIGAPTRLFSQLATLYNVTFAPMNMTKDVWEKSELVRTRDLVDAQGNKVDGDKVALKMVSLAFSPAVWRATARSAMGLPMENTQEAKALRDLQLNGGISTWGDHFAKRRGDLVQEVKDSDSKLMKVKGAVDAYNNTFEMVSALSSYMAMKDQGVATKEAAYQSLDLMNFRKQGAIMGPLRAVYAFAQPIVTGGANLVGALKTRKGQARFAAYVVLGGMLYAALRGMADDDEAGNQLDNVGSFVLERTIPIPFGDGVLKIPVGFGLPSLAWSWATNIVKMLAGEQTVGEAATEMVLRNAVKTFSPIQPTEISASKDTAAFLWTSIAPTVFKPSMQLAVNKTAFGAPIEPKFYDKEVFKSEQGREQTAQFYKDVARELRELTGKDLFPEQVKVLVDGFAIGPMRQLLQMAVTNPNKERLGKPTDTPVLSAVYQNWNDNAKQGKFYAALDEATTLEQRKNSGEKITDPEDQKKMQWYADWEKEAKRFTNQKAAITRRKLPEELDKKLKDAVAKERDAAQAKYLMRWRIIEGKTTKQTPA